MSDPFENIDNEVYLEKIKNFFYKYKIIIIVIVTLFILNDYLVTTLPDIFPGSISSLGEALNFWEWSLIASTPLVFILLSLITVWVSVVFLLGKLK